MKYNGIGPSDTLSYFEKFRNKKIIQINLSFWSCASDFR